MIIIIIMAGFFAFIFIRRLTRRRNVELMGERPYRYQMDSRRSNSGWKGGF